MREIGQEGVAHLVFYAFAVVSSFVDADAGVGTGGADFVSWQNLYGVVKPTNKPSASISSPLQKIQKAVYCKKTKV